LNLFTDFFDFFSNNHIQDVLVVSYLANTIRTQMELSNRLATAQLTLGGGESTGAGQGGEGQRNNQRGGKGGNRPRQDRAQAEEARA
jgi:translation initiation factor 3 subunit F